jgi:signal transduction histidine kinase
MNDATILIVDDDPVVLTAMNKELASAYRVRAANSASQALKAASSSPRPDLILLDVMMPGMNGYAVLSKLKENSVTCDIPVIFVSSMDAVENEEKGLALGAMDYLTKPINPAILQARVKTQLALKQASDFLHDKNTYLEAEVERRVENERLIMKVVIENNAERQRLLDENRRLLKQSMKIQEEERRYLARELHDELGQALAGIRMDVDFIRGTITDMESEEMAAAEDIQTILDDTNSRIRGMTERLRPMTIDYLGIEEATREMVEKWKSRNRSIECVLTIIGKLDGLSETLDLTLYRIIQESLTNVARHAVANQVLVRIERLADSIRISIQDNGQGMDKDHTASGLGQIGMRERVQVSDGTFEIENRPGEGVTIMAILPLAESSHQDNENLNE